MHQSKLQNKKILLGITGSISAYKTPILVRELIRAGAEVKVAMTTSAMKFVTKDTLINLSKHHVAVDIFDEDLYQDGAWHIHLAHWCDAYLIAPTSATTLSRLASGNCDTTVSALYVALPRNKKAIIAPAMDHDMYMHPTTQANIERIISHGTLIIEPEEGELSSGIVGKGRLPEPLDLVEKLSQILSNSPTQGNKGNMLITAGPTLEKIDDVRFISNFSSGKMGIAIANEAVKLDWNVKLVLGPINKEVRNEIHNEVRIIDVESATEMMKACDAIYDSADTIIMAAAVADYRTERYDGKLKKDNSGELNLSLIENPDILRTISERNTNNKDNKFIIGFALESQDAIENAKAKLLAKKCNILILNRADQSGSGFGGNMNTITVLQKNGNEIVTQAYPQMPKTECAKIILATIEA